MNTQVQRNWLEDVRFFDKWLGDGHGYEFAQAALEK